MEDRQESTVESRKTWEAPQLKKIDVEEVTANTIGDESDAETSS